MLIDESTLSANKFRQKLRENYRADEAKQLEQLLHSLSDYPQTHQQKVKARATSLVKRVRELEVSVGGIDAFMQEFDLSSKEGIVLMCLAEALLRVPDEDTVDRLIQDKLTTADWSAHIGHSDSLFVNASAWALMLTGRVVRLDKAGDRNAGAVIKKLVQRGGEPLIRAAMRRAMRIMGHQFVLGRTIDEALSRARKSSSNRETHSFDMLGEAARTMEDAERYFQSYAAAIQSIAAASTNAYPVSSAGISVKLSALHPRYEFSQRDRVLNELLPRLKNLCLLARDANIGLTIDAEEADRLDLSLDILEQLCEDPDLAQWQGLGLAIQAYQKRCFSLIDWLADLASKHQRRLMVRLVKGAYWDTEIKRAQLSGQPDYPVFTRKMNTDVSYLACAQKLLARPNCFYPQFATHNAHSVCALIEMAGDREFEFQRLHGMGESLYQALAESGINTGVRVYAPVGSHEDLLAYLVRRLLENGANTSFVNRIQDEEIPLDQLVEDPVDRAKKASQARHPRIPLPADIYRPDRANSAGLDLTCHADLQQLQQGLKASLDFKRTAAPVIDGEQLEGSAEAAWPVHNPTRLDQTVGQVYPASAEVIDTAMQSARKAFNRWDHVPANERASILEKAADLYETHLAEFIGLCSTEAGKSLADGIAEVREAVEFLHYYAARARDEFSQAKVLQGPTGQRDEYSLHGRGVFLCISPWNFPLAIFTGQVSAALAAGNAVVAKPAEQTSLTAMLAVRLLHEAGIPGDVLHLIPGDGAKVGPPLLAHPYLAGVAFTGSTETAALIHRSLANREGAILPLIAETGGVNAMIVDSTALLEQVVVDVLASAFQSAGQRCSALRVLFAQEEIAEPLIRMLKGAMQELRVGDPMQLKTDIGPVIDSESLGRLKQHVERMKSTAKLLYQTPLPEDLHGHFMAPTLFEIDSLADLPGEVFGPILHLVRYPAKGLEKVIDSINDSGYGLTLGIHSRLDTRVEAIRKRARVGNLYVNRNQIGAVVGVQPFGGEGLSGTGPKAGGPQYLRRFATERSLSVDTTASGGNASLLSLEEDFPGQN